MLVFGTLLLVIALPCIFYTRNESVEVNGVPFKVWVAQNRDMQVQDSLATIGTNAIPQFVRILNEPHESARAFKVKSWIWRNLPQQLQSRLTHWYPVPREQLKRTALFGLRYFGPEAAAALPDIIQMSRSETNTMLRAGALVAALKIAPEMPEVFALWRNEWVQTNHFSRHDLAIYIAMTRRPVPAAVPFLMKELETNPESVNVLEAFEFFGESARPAVPYMVKMLRSTPFRENMIHLLQALGPVAAGAVPDLVPLLNDNDPSLVAGVLVALKSIGPAARPALPAVNSLIAHDDPVVRLLAAATAAWIENNHERAVPLLMDALEGRIKGATKCSMKYEFHQELPPAATSSGREIAAILLGEFGEASRPALPALEKCLNDKKIWMRLAAAEAIWRIDGDANRTLPVVIQILDEQPQPNSAKSVSADDYVIVRAIEIIEQMGIAATNAIPALERVRTHSMTSRRASISALQRLNAKVP